ncbi:tektin-3-like [Chanos chanos]|uniref:Tektin n=1 Tax=Chanos chanos TaxID=29144 RepID=A0A6J2WMY6_CHACN|nr:tektin-5 [Chanos chanos]
MKPPVSPDDWYRSNSANYTRSESSRRNAENFRMDTTRLIQCKDQLTMKTQTETSRWVGERIVDIAFWSNEIKHEIEQLMKATETLRQMKFRLDKAIVETEGPSQVTWECLYQRQKRMGSDQVDDDVEKELLQEVAVIKSCQEHLERVRDKVKKQLEGNRETQHMLEMDLNDKHTAYEIDSKCYKFINCNTNVNLYPNLNKMDKSVSVPKTWARFSEDNILRSQAERMLSLKVREEVERLLEKTAADMWNQFNQVNVAFTHRITEIAEAKRRLETHLAMTLQEMFQTEKTITDLEQAISDKRLPLKVAQNRLEERTRRPNMELCRDPAHTRLLKEVDYIQDTVQTLRQRLSEAHNTLQQLADTKSILEHELFVKANSLFIDQERCMALRKTFPSNPRLVGYT